MPLNKLQPQASAASGAPRRVLFFGKSMSRSRCTGGLVDALRGHGLQVRWVNMATQRRWFGGERAMRRARRVYESFRPDLVLVFCQDLPAPLLGEITGRTPVVLWIEERFDHLDPEMVDYMRQARLVCVSNPAHRDALHQQGVSQAVFLMSGFSPRYHFPAPPREPERDVVFVGGPGRHGDRARFVQRLSQHFDTEVFGVTDAWAPWADSVRVRPAVANRGLRRLCASSRVVLGLNQFNDDPLYFSNRTFLTLACGGFHVTHYVPGLETVFTDGEHLAWYRDVDECVEVIGRYLADPAARARIARQGHELVMDAHQYHHRVARILELLGTARVPVAEPPPPSALRQGVQRLASSLTSSS